MDAQFIILGSSAVAFLARTTLDVEAIGAAIRRRGILCIYIEVVAISVCHSRRL